MKNEVLAPSHRFQCSGVREHHVTLKSEISHELLQLGCCSANYTFLSEMLTPET